MREDNTHKKTTCIKIATEGIAALIAEAGAYWLHTLWTVQQENNITKPLSLFQTYQHVRQQGVRYQQLFRGFSVAGCAAVIGIFPYLQGARCAIDWFGDNHFGQFMQGPCAHAAAAVIYVPALRLVELEQASVTNTTQNAFKQLSVFNKSKMILKESGIRGFYRGAFPHICINSINDGVGFWLTARMLLCLPKEQRNNVLPQLFCTLLGFGTAYAITTPLAIAETRLRIHETNPAAFPDKTFFPTMKTLYRKQGVRGFFNGTSTAFLYGAIIALPVACDGVLGRAH